MEGIRYWCLNRVTSTSCFVVILLAQECSAFERRVFDCSLSLVPGVCFSGFDWLGHTYGREEGDPPNGPVPLSNSTFGGSEDVDLLYDLIGEVHAYYGDTFSRDGVNGHGGAGDGDLIALDRYVAQAHLDLVLPSLCGTEGGAQADGSGRTGFCGGDVEPDTVGHEYAHVLVANLEDTADGESRRLIYEGESGAIEESMADFFGEALERYVTGNSDWLVNRRSGATERSLADPSGVVSDTYGVASPDRYLSPLFLEDGSDAAIVHVNAGILNKAAYLASEGGVFNGYTVEGIGFEKVEQIWFRALTEYFVADETFNLAYTHLLAAANDLYPSDDVARLDHALRAVEIDQSRVIPEPCSLYLAVIVMAAWQRVTRRRVTAKL